MKLTQLQYSTDRRGTLRLYVYNEDGSGYAVREYFAKTIRYPDEEIPVAVAREICEKASVEGREVRITNGGDLLVFHAKDGEVVYPAEGLEKFWESIA